jgi:hypothetical protein
MVRYGQGQLDRKSLARQILLVGLVYTAPTLTEDIARLVIQCVGLHSPFTDGNCFLRGECHEIYVFSGFFSFEQFFLTPLDMPWKDLDFFQIFVEVLMFVIHSKVHSKLESMRIPEVRAFFNMNHKFLCSYSPFYEWLPYWRVRMVCFKN